MASSPISPEKVTQLLTDWRDGRGAALTVGLAEAMNEVGRGKYADVSFDEERLKELRYACLLHDFGKVGVREHVLVKEKKLYPANMELLKARFAFVQRSIQQSYTEKKLSPAMERGGELHDHDFHTLDKKMNQENGKLRATYEAVIGATERS